MSRAENKATRLLQIENLLLAHPEGLTQAQIAERVHVDRSTITRYIPDFPKHIYYDEEDGRRWKVDRTADLINVCFSLHEANAVHLASRLLVTRMDKQNPYAASALRKLGIALERIAPHISNHLSQSADVMDTAAQRHDPNFLRTLEQLTLAWAEGRKVKIWHRQTCSDKAYSYIFSPYFIEPYAVGQSVHVIGFREPPEAIRTFKIERIERIEALNECYSIPAHFDPRDLLKDAWGIWYTEAEPVRVVLKFHASIARRIKETRWHASEQIIDQPDGSILWEAHIAEPKEMLPWIRGFGADVEVLEPEGMRTALAREMRAVAEMYGKEEPLLQTVNFYAHSNELDESHWQSVKAHLTNTADIAKRLGMDAGISEYCYIAALLHDIGKYSVAYQKRLRGGKKVDHSTAGAQLIMERFQAIPAEQAMAKLLAYCITGHHAGLPDHGSVISLEDGTLEARLKKPLHDFSSFKDEIDVAQLAFPKYLPIRSTTPSSEFSMAFFTRMIYSTLVDADFIETETFMNNGMKPRGGYADIETLCIQFDQFLSRFENPQDVINKRRTATLTACMEKAQADQGLFRLTVPTGGGKTFSSMAFALHHAVRHGLKRIIYVIPYTSIIEQNAAEFKQSLGVDNVLEHHSNFDWHENKMQEETAQQDDKTHNTLAKLKLATENWDIPIVVTTNVQFFESLFANRSSRSRKIHNIAKSVVIFDEAQMLPMDYLKPCMAAVYELVRNYGVSAVFCTATQPDIQQFFPKAAKFQELTADPQELYRFYKRVQVSSLGKIPDAELTQRINAHLQALCIVNTRKHAKGLFDEILPEGRFHLSTLMCPAHRKQTIAEVRERLAAKQTCRVISTQIMEAGIDVDFPVGYRAIAGLDSIIQAAGRVNREGKSAQGNLFVFEPDSIFVKRTPAYIEQGASAARNILRKYEDPISLEAIATYYALFYGDLRGQGDFDRKKIMKYFEKGMRNELNFDFKSAAEAFRMIENTTMSVIIPFDAEAEALIDQLPDSRFPLTILRALQLYTVNIYEKEFQALQEIGAFSFYNDAYAVLRTKQEHYDDETGLKIPEQVSGEGLFFE